MPLKAFISYSHKDEKYKEELEKFLSPLGQKGIMEYWDAGQLLVGDKFDAEIIQKINQSDVFLFLISPDSISSDYIKNVELKRAMELYANQQMVIVPIILRPCNWQMLDIKKFHAVPKGGYPITKRSNQDEAYKEIVDEIEKLAKGLIYRKEPIREKRIKKDKNQNKKSNSQTNFFKKIKTDTFINQVDNLKININKKKK